MCELLNYWLDFELWVRVGIMGELLKNGRTFKLLGKMDFFLCEIGFLQMQY